MSRQDSRKSKIFVGMSGGVDSSVSAALLKESGHDVTGVFIKVWQPDWIECNWKEERIEAMRAAAHLDIPFVTLDLEKEYKQGVIDYMIAEYAAGRTPNPDVMCNREVKFGAFWRWAEAQGADYIATGHYARNEAGRRGSKEGRALLAGVDSNKDQSYFLWTLNQGDLKHVIFPVGGLTKPEVRKLAAKFGLPNADKKDSQGLCFIGKVDVKEFLAHYTKGNPASLPGKVLDEKGEAIGTHPGALFFTIGERRGFEIGARHKTPHDQPFFVVSKDVKANTITVSDSKVGPNKVRPISLENVSFVNGIPPVGSRFKARTRYRQQLENIEISSISQDSSKMEIRFENDPEAVTPGQSLVIYDGNECIGGGVIS